MALAETLLNTTNMTLDSLNIENYRAFRHLNIPHLGRVNLITGKNNVGKSSILEASLLYARSGSPPIIRDLLDNRDELRMPSETKDQSAISPGRFQQEEDSNTSAVRHLFHGRTNIDDLRTPISIGVASDEAKSLSIDIKWYVTVQVVEEDQAEERLVNRQLISILPEQRFDFDNAALYLTANIGERQLYRLRLERLLSRPFGRILPDPPSINSQYIRSMGLDDNQLGRLWDVITATALEDDVLNALRIIAPNLERIVIVGEERSTTRGRTLLAKVAGLERVPLRSFGDGMNRLFGITLGLVNSQNGLFLVDEVDNGLHYSVLPYVWRFIFQLARELNIQVLATTHSWDCIQAFQQAAEEDEQDEGVLIRLQNQNGEVTATVFDERRLAVVTREQIEVR